MPQPPRYTTVTDVGATITGVVTADSMLHADYSDALLARRRPDLKAKTGVVHWDLILQAVGPASALTAWVAIVGGATLWARMESIDAPALPTLAALGQSWMVTAGLQTLLVPILLGSVVAVLVYYSHWDADPTSPSIDHGPATNLQETVPAAVEHAGSAILPLRRLRPLVVPRRLRRRTGRVEALPVIVIGGLFAAGLYVAQASWVILVSTFAVLVAGVVGTVGTASGRQHVTWRLALTAAAGCVVALVWYSSGVEGWALLSLGCCSGSADG
jgi:hypothetical protein